MNLKLNLKLLLLFLFIMTASVCYADTKKITRADAALYIAEYLNIKHTDDPKTLYGLAYGIFAGDYLNDNDVSSYDKIMTLEVEIVTLVRYMGWNTVQYDTSKIDLVDDYVTKEGYPHYAPDPTPRSIPYVIVALDKGLLKKGELSNLKTEIGYETLKKYLERLTSIKESLKVEKSIIEYDGKSNTIQKNSGKLIIVNEGHVENKELANGNNTILDMRSNGVRLYHGENNISNGKQDYFPLGPLATTLAVGKGVAANDYSHQAEAIYGTIRNNSTTVNAVGIWGNAESKQKGARVWGGFFNVSGSEGEKNDAQLVGVEIDVTNNMKDGVHPNASKVGMQIVALGNKLSTNSIEILAAGEGAGWVNGLLFGNGSIASNGTVIGTSQKEIATGIDFSNTKFTNAAMSLAPNSKIVLKTQDGYGTIYGDDIGAGHLVIQSGKGGIRIVNNENNENLLIINNDGTIDKDCLFYKNYLSNQKLSVKESNDHNICYLLIIIITTIFSYCIYTLKKQNNEIKKEISDIYLQIEKLKTK